ncbi:MAG: ParB/RepB/Spo0J family partition protein [Firmicutes bacterium]|nr:ParB/RepB/Spo0J family partition protein [Bacillota bacterium]
MAVRKAGGLGRGLNALFEDSSINEEVSVEVSDNDSDEMLSDGVNYININEIKPNASQPRKDFDEDKIADLAESIRMHGVIQPVIVRPIETGFELVAGERRWRAARKAELRMIPSIIRELDDRENMLLAIIENMQREDLNPIEEATAFSQVMDQYGLTQDEVSKSVGKSRPYITNALRLLKLPELVRELVVQGRLSGGHARAIAGVEDEMRQIELARLACDGKLSVRALEQLISQSPEKQKKKKNSVEKTQDILAVETELKDILGTKVSLPASKDKGKIEISFYSRDELERLIDILKSVRRE